MLFQIAECMEAKATARQGTRRRTETVKEVVTIVEGVMTAAGQMQAMKTAVVLVKIPPHRLAHV